MPNVGVCLSDDDEREEKKRNVLPVFLVTISRVEGRMREREDCHAGLPVWAHPSSTSPFHQFHYRPRRGFGRLRSLTTTLPSSSSLSATTHVTLVSSPPSQCVVSLGRRSNASLPLVLQHACAAKRHVYDDAASQAMLGDRNSPQPLPYLTTASGCGHKRKAPANTGGMLLAPPRPGGQGQGQGQQGLLLVLLMDVMREALGVLQLVEESRQDEGLGLGLELKELSCLVTSTVAVCQKTLQGLSGQLLALLSHTTDGSRYGHTHMTSSAAAAAAPPMPAAAAAATAAAAAPMPPAGAYPGVSYGASRNAPSQPTQPYTWGEASVSGVCLVGTEEEPDPAALDYLLVRWRVALNWLALVLP
jgi:hypothetical protein